MGKLESNKKKKEESKTKKEKQVTPKKKKQKNTYHHNLGARIFAVIMLILMVGSVIATIATYVR